MDKSTRKISSLLKFLDVLLRGLRREEGTLAHLREKVNLKEKYATVNNEKSALSSLVSWPQQMK